MKILPAASDRRKPSALSVMPMASTALQSLFHAQSGEQERNIRRIQRRTLAQTKTAFIGARKDHGLNQELLWM
jgi:hypothetical protein